MRRFSNNAQTKIEIQLLENEHKTKSIIHVYLYRNVCIEILKQTLKIKSKKYKNKFIN